ncbi:MAG TPA: TMEM175 family protein [Chitinophagaceae bacterium]|nr:TMEM175 family protein [Chitinophagaceae bacterium]
MGKGRVEAFSDGVMAIIITVMLLEIKVPHGDELNLLKPVVPVFISYILSFIYLGIYWNNHHHMMHSVQHVNGKVLWANTHLLFWLSLIPFATGWMGENNFTKWPVILYGTILLMCGVAYYILSQTLIGLHGKNSTIANAIGSDKKGKLSVVIYAFAIALSFINPWIGMALYTIVAAMWIIPDKRIEKKLMSQEKE